MKWLLLLIVLVVIPAADANHQGGNDSQHGSHGEKDKSGEKSHGSKDKNVKKKLSDQFKTICELGFQGLIYFDVIYHHQIVALMDECPEILRFLWHHPYIPHRQLTYVSINRDSPRRFVRHVELDYVVSFCDKVIAKPEELPKLPKVVIKCNSLKEAIENEKEKERKRATV